jgi:hypothetical protein
VAGAGFLGLSAGGAARPVREAIARLDLGETPDWRSAISGFEAAIAIQPQDGISQMYIECCQHCPVEPQADDWDGVWTLTSK